jgi:HEAT repeat protein
MFIDISKDQSVFSDTRFAAIRALADMTDIEDKDKITPYIIPLLKDDHPNIRGAAVYTLTKLDPSKAFPSLLELAFKDENTFTQESYRTTLESIVNRLPVEYFIIELKNENLNIRRYAAKSLVKVAKKSNIPVLVETLLADKDQVVRMSITEALKNFRETENLPSVMGLLKNEDPIVNKCAVKWLSVFYLFSSENTPELTSSLFALLKKEPTLKEEIEPILAKIVQNPSVLLNLLQDNDVTTKIVAIKLLGNLKSKQSAQPLINLLNAQNDLVLKETIIALSKIKAKDSIALLLNLTNHKNAEVRSAVLAALGDLEAKETFQISTEMLSDSNLYVRKIAVKNLGNLANKDATNILLNLLKKEDLSRDAIYALAKTENKEIVTTGLLNMLSSQDKNLQRVVILALAELGGKEIFLHLVDRLLVENKEISDYIIQTLNKEEYYLTLIRFNITDEAEIKKVANSLVYKLINSDKDTSEIIINLVNKLDPQLRLVFMITLLKPENLTSCLQFIYRFSFSLSEPPYSELKETKDFIKALLTILQNKTLPENSLYYVFNLLASSKTKEITPILLTILKDKNETAELRSYVVRLIGKMQITEAIPELIDRFEHDDSLDLISTVDTLSDLKCKEATALLHKLLKNINANYQRKFANLTCHLALALGKLGAKEAIPDLVISFDKLDFHVDYPPLFQYFLQAYEQLEAKEAIPSLIKVLNYKKPLYFTQSLINTLVKLKAKEASPILIKLLSEPRNYIDSTAASALGELDVKESVPNLIELFNAQKAKNIATASVTSALGKLKTKEAILFLINELGTDIYAKDALLNVGKEAISPLIATLKDSNQAIKTRYNAAEILDELQAKEAIPVFIDLLGDDDEQLQNTAFYKLLNLATKENFLEFRALLKSKNDSVRRKSARLLIEMGDKQAIPLIINVLNDQNAKVRNSVAYSLGLSEDSKPIQPLMNLLRNKHEQEDIRLTAIESLASLKANQAIPLLISIFNDSKELQSIRIQAAYSLEKLTPQQAKTLAFSALNSKEQYIRETAAYILGHLGAKEAVPILVEIFNNSPEQRPKVLEAFQTIDTPEIIPLILEVLKDDVGYVKYSARLALEYIKSKEAIPGLIKALANEDFTVTAEVVTVLGRLEAKEAIPALVDLSNKLKKSLKSSYNYKIHSGYVYARVMPVLFQLGEQTVETELLNTLKDKSYSGLFDSVITALGSIKSKKAVPQLITILEDKSSSYFLRSRAAEALGNIGDKSSIPYLVAALTNNDLEVRISAIKALGSLGAKEAIPDLVKLLDDKQNRVVSTTIDTLGILQSKKTVSVLTPFLENTNSEIRTKAKKAIAEIMKMDTK